MATGERLTVAQFRALEGKKGPIEGPRAPQGVKGNSMYALGRLPPGVMNKTEERFLHEWIEPLQQSGDIVWWAFEGIKLRLAGNTFFTADFAVMMGDGHIDIIDVKGAQHLITDDANVKIKVAAERYPFRFNFAWPTARRGSWHVEGVGR